MVTKVTKWEAKDGEMFETDIAATAHEAKLDLHGIIEESRDNGFDPLTNVSHLSTFLINNPSVLAAHQNVIDMSTQETPVDNSTPLRDAKKPVYYYTDSYRDGYNFMVSTDNKIFRHFDHVAELSHDTTIPDANYVYTKERITTDCAVYTLADSPNYQYQYKIPNSNQRMYFDSPDELVDKLLERYGQLITPVKGVGVK